MRGDGSLGYLSRETSHYSSHHHNNDGISDDESLAVPVDDGICGHMSLDTSHSSSRNRGFIIAVMMLEVDLGLKITETISIATVKFIILVLMAEAEIGLKRPATIPLAVWKKPLVVIGEVDMVPSHPL